MARKRPGVVAVRRIVAGMCIFVGLFVACFGLGNGRQSLMVTGIAIMVLAATTRVVIGFRRAPKEWLHGVGRVLEVSEPPADARLGRCSLQLVVDVPGMPEETVVVHDSRVPVSQWPQPGQQLPIHVAADDIRDVRVQWRDFVPVELPIEAAWDTDEPAPSPAVPPGSHLDPSPVIDFDLDHPPTGPLEPVAPIDRHTVETLEPLDPAELAEPASAVAPAEASPPDEGRLDADTPLTDDRGGVAPAAGDDGRSETAAPPDEVAQLAPSPATAGAEGGAGRVPRPRPSPKPRHAPGPAPATVGAAAAATAAAGATNGANHPGGGRVGGGGPGDLVTTYPSAHPGPAGAINGIGMTLLVSDLTQSVGFYRDRLGFYEVDTGAGTIVLASGDTRLVLRAVQNLGAIRQRPMHLNLEVSDIEAVYAELKANGVRFTSPPRAVEQTARLQLWAAAFKDPDGHGIALTQWRPTPASAG